MHRLRATALLCVSLLFLPVLSVLPHVTEPVGEEDANYDSSDQIKDAVDPVLRKFLNAPHTMPSMYVHETDGIGNWQVIAQFDSPLQDSDFTQNGVKILKQTSIIEAYLLEGTPLQIMELSLHPDLTWLEWNAPRKLLMDTTVDVISAREAWDMARLRADGGFDIGSTGPRGSGVSVIVLDSGIDATHPDMNYAPQSVNNPNTPALEDKVIYNAKLDQGTGVGTPGFAWIPLQNTDTTSGHGTHCAGTVAGNGDASGGRYVGVAPDAWLIGLSMGELAFTIDEYAGLEYAYTLSRPGSETQEAWNIRVVSNSWGPGFPFDSADANDLSVQMIEKITKENNVVVVFANGNDGGDGSDDRSNIFAKVPAAIGVAAATRDGTGMSTFSSRGEANVRDTWPDIAAPGVDIWSAAARATMIGGADGAGDLVGGELDHYYLSISGTSMATPHIAGVVALMFEVAPSMTMSSLEEDLDVEGNPVLHDPTGFSSPQEAERYIHEAEAILKLTADYMEGGENLASNFSNGLGNNPLDYAQGYGLVNTTNAVAFAHTLQILRDPDLDGNVDNPDISIWDAYAVYAQSQGERVVRQTGSQLMASWTGEFAVFSSDVSIPPASAHRHKVWVPEGTTRVTMNLDYSPLPTSILCPSAANLRLALDMDGDGTYELDDVNGEELTFQGGLESGMWWYYDVQGSAVGNCFSTNPSTGGPRSPYLVEHRSYLPPGEHYLTMKQMRGMTVEGTEGATVVHTQPVLQNPAYQEPETELSGLAGAFSWMQENWWLPLIVGIFITISMILSNDKARSYLLTNKEQEHEDIYVAEIVAPSTMPPVQAPQRGGLLARSTLTDQRD